MILALATAAGVCCFLACSSFQKIDTICAARTALTAVVLSLIFSRIIYWYGRPDSFSSFIQAVFSTSTEHFALLGAFAGCGLAAIITGRQVGKRNLLDCMSIAGCLAIAFGRMGCFFSDADRGQIMTSLTGLPWAWPVTNVSGSLEYRFATFVFQGAFAAALGAFLAGLFFQKKARQGDVTILFLLCYCASQILLDSTRYDSLYLRSNGFVSMVQVVSLITLIIVLVLLCIRAVEALGFRKWMIPIWISLPGLLGGAGYMEYYVQRHGREAAYSYSIMGICLAGTVSLGILLWRMSLCKNKK
jgi:prolipoprotein diacylglyceryltransferase